MAVAALSAPVTVDDPVCKVVDTNGVNTFSSIADAVTYITAVSESSFATQFAGSGGTATIEMLKGEVTQTATVNVSLGASRPTALTTAKTAAAGCTDGYPYKGDTTAEGGRAVVKRGFKSENTSFGDTAMFYVSSSSDFTVSDIVMDGVAETYTNGNRGDFIGVNGGTVTLAGKALLRNSKCTDAAGAFLAYGQTNSSTIIMKDDAQVENCQAPYGGMVHLAYAKTKLVMQGNAKVSGCVASNCGGAISAYAATVDISGNATISGNSAAGFGSAIEGRSATKIIVSGNARIENNTFTGTSTNIWQTSAIGTDANNTGKFTVTVSGSPFIYNNKNQSEAQANIAELTSLDSGAQITVGEDGLNADAQIGINAVNNCNAGNIFARTATAKSTDCENLSTFVNDQDSSMVGTAGTDNAVMWTNAVVKETTTANAVKYYKSLDKAITEATDGSTLEILRSHALTGDATTGTKNLTIQNIVTPANNAEDPKKNGSTNDDNGEPIVYFTTGTATDGRITIGSGTATTVTIKGVHFSGKYLDGTTVGARSRSASGMAVSANATLNIADGDTTGTYMDGSAHAPAPTIVEDFVNTSTTNAAAGGFALVNGTLTIESGTITGCKCAGYFWKGGGAVAFQNNGSTVNLKGGLITNNGQSDSSGYLCGPFAMIGGTFNMHGGTIKKNTSRVGGAIGHANAGEDSAVSAATINIYDGNILENSAAAFDGGALQISSSTTCNISGGIIAKNYAKRSSGAINMRPGCTLAISGHPVITGNTSSATTVYGAAISTISSYGATPITISGNPVIYGNTNGNGDAADINLGSNANLKVGVMEKGAVVGYTSATAALVASGGQFGTSTQSAATSSGYLAGFYNNVTKSAAGLALRGSAGDATAVVWATNDPNVKLTETATASISDGTTSEYSVVHTFSTIAEAVECVGALPAANMPTYAEGAGVDSDIMDYYKMEVLINELTQTAAVSVAVGADKPLMLTTAKTAAAGCTDGYPYRGDTSKESGRAVVKRGFTGGPLFRLGNDDGGSADLTVKNIVCDGVSGTYSTSVSSTIGELRAFYLRANAALTLDDGALVRNSDAGGNSSTSSFVGGAVCMYERDTEEKASKLCMKDGSVIDLCTAPSGAGVYISHGCNSMVMEGGTISNCTANYGGAVYNKAGDFTMTGGTISKCTAIHTADTTRGAGGAIFNYGTSSVGKATVVVTGDAKITGCKAGSGSAIYNRSSSNFLTISGNAQITGNILSASDGAQPAAIADHGDALGKSAVVVAGSPSIYDNLDYTETEQRNVLDNSGLNVGSVIVVGVQDDDGNVTGLEEGAKIGVYATTNYNAGNTFARTATTKSTDYANLSAFVNDKNTRLTGLASAADPYNRVVWSSAEKLVLKKVLPSAVAHDTWFTVQVKDTDSGEVYRQAIKVAAGSTEGSATVLVQSGVAYEVADASEQSSWRYEADSTSYAGATATTPADAWTADATKATLGTLTLACPDVSAYDPDTTDTPRTLTMTVKEKSGAQGWYADSASVVNTITMS